jgi:hypothetical protein
MIFRCLNLSVTMILSDVPAHQEGAQVDYGRWNCTLNGLQQRFSRSLPQAPE